MRTVRTIGATSTPVLDANPLRRKVVLTNNSDEDMYIAPDAVSVATEGIPLVAAGGSVEDEPDNQDRIYTGMWTGICASGGKLLSVVELNR